MAITTEAGYINAKAIGRFSPLQKSSVANMVAGSICSLYRAAGTNPAQPAIPSTAVVCTRATDGAMYFPVAGGSNSKYIDNFILNDTVANTIHIVDRICHFGGLSGTVTTAQTVTTPTLPARATPEACEWYLEWYTDTGATAVNATVAVTNTDASTSNIVVALAATRRAGMLLQILPATGKIIAVVNNVTLSATTGTAGNFGVTCVQDLGVAGVIGVANIADRAESLVLPLAGPDACLMGVVDCTTTSTGVINGGVRVIEG